MYLDWKTKSDTEEIYNNKKVNFKTYERIVNINIKETKKKYYHDTFKNYKNNMKKTWKTISETLGKRKKDTCGPTTVTYNDKVCSKPAEIADAFNHYFANIGTSLSSSIQSMTHDLTYTQYLRTPSRCNCTFTIIYIMKMKLPK